MTALRCALGGEFLNKAPMTKAVCNKSHFFRFHTAETRGYNLHAATCKRSSGKAAHGTLSQNATNATDTQLQGAALRTFSRSDRASPPSHPCSSAAAPAAAAAAAAAASAPAASGGLGAASIHGTVAPRASTTVTKLVSSPLPHAAQTPAGSETPAWAGTGRYVDQVR